MADPFTNVLSNLGLSGTLNMVISIGFGLIILLVVGVLLFWLTQRWKAPIRYDAEIFEKFGQGFRVRPGFVFFKRTVEDTGYYVDKRKIELTVSQAFLSSKGKPKFYLLRLEDRYVPLTLDEAMKIRLTKKGEKMTIKVAKFLAVSKLDEYEKALTESIKHDARKYRWIDKLAPLTMIILPMVALMVMFFLAAWVARSNAEITSEISGLENEFAAISTSFGRSATAWELIAERWGGSVVPPPG